MDDFLINQINNLNNMAYIIIDNLKNNQIEQGIALDMMSKLKESLLDCYNARIKLGMQENYPDDLIQKVENTRNSALNSLDLALSDILSNKKESEIAKAFK